MAAPTSRIIITADADGAISELLDVDRAAQRTDQALEAVKTTTIDVDADTSDLDTARREIRDLTDKEYSLRLDVDSSQIDTAARRMRTLDSRTSGTAETFQRGIGPLRGFTDELGGSSAGAGVAAAAMIDAGEAVEIFGARAGLSQRTLGRVSTLLGGIGLAAGAAGIAWGLYKKSQDEAAEASRKLRDIGAQLLDQKYEEAAGALVEQYSDVFDKAVALGVPVREVGEYITGQARDMPTLTAQIDAQKRIWDGTLEDVRTIDQLRADGLVDQYKLLKETTRTRDVLGSQLSVLEQQRTVATVLTQTWKDSAGNVDTINKRLEQTQLRTEALAKGISIPIDLDYGAALADLETSVAQAAQRAASSVTNITVNAGSADSRTVAAELERQRRIGSGGLYR